MKPLLFLFSIMCLASCSIRKANGNLNRREGYFYYSGKDPDIEIQLFGDYWVHPFKKKYFLNAGENFLRYATAKLNNIKPFLMFSSHTIVQPYYASFGI